MKTLRGINSGRGGDRRKIVMLAFEEFLCRGGEKQDSRGGSVGSAKHSFKRREKSAVCMLLGLISQTGKH